MSAVHEFVRRRLSAQSALWNSFGNAVFAACQWGLLALLAHQSGAGEVGRYAYALAVTTPVAMFLNLGLRDGQSSVRAVSFPFAAFVRTRSTMLVVGLAILVGIAATGVAVDPLVYAVAAAKAAESMSDLCYGHFQRAQRLDLVARSVLVRGLGGLLVFGLALSVGAETTIAVAAMAGLWTAITLAWDLRGASRLRLDEETRFDAPHRLSTLAMIGQHLPLGVTALLVALNVNAPRYAIEAAYGETALGVFVAAWYLQVAGLIVVNSIGQARVIHLSRALRSGQGFVAQLLGLVRSVVLLGLLGGVCALVFGDVFLRTFYGPEFVAGWTCLLVIAFGSVLTFASTALNFGLVAAGDFRGQTLAAVANTVATVLVSGVLVPAIGIEGGAYAMLVGSVVHMPIAVARLRRATKQEARP